ncbi:hypothetical protein JCM11251_002376 [Rhodosporidiobolus azoricus]
MTRTAVLTVGSTRFDSLVHSFFQPSVLSALAALGVSTVFAQVGNSELPIGWTHGQRKAHGAMQVELVRFASDVEGRVGRADIVVSHAGAGSILSFLRPLPSSSASTSGNADSSSTTAAAANPDRRHLILVPNSTLMDSHQSDLADEMQRKGWAIVCENPEGLPAALEKLLQAGKAGSALPEPAYLPMDEGKVQRILDETLGYV